MSITTIRLADGSEQAAQLWGMGPTDGTRWYVTADQRALVTCIRAKCQCRRRGADVAHLVAA